MQKNNGIVRVRCWLLISFLSTLLFLAFTTTFTTVMGVIVV